MEEWVLALAASPWVFVATYLLCMIDGFFPPVPSESVVIALAVLSSSSGAPNLVILAVVAALGAFCGDQIAYVIGRKIDLPNSRLSRTRRGARAIEVATRTLTKRGALYIFAARYVPIGRVAVNMTAGSIRYDRRHFLTLTSLSALVWSVYSIALGLSASAWFDEHPLVAMIVGIVLGVVIGAAVEWLLALVRRWRVARSKTPVARSH